VAALQSVRVAWEADRLGGQPLPACIVHSLCTACHHPNCRLTCCAPRRPPRRVILYDIKSLHNAYIPDAAALNRNPAYGRLTMNGFLYESQPHHCARRTSCTKCRDAFGCSWCLAEALCKLDNLGACESTDSTMQVGRTTNNWDCRDEESATSSSVGRRGKRHRQRLQPRSAAAYKCTQDCAQRCVSEKCPRSPTACAPECSAQCVQLCAQSEREKGEL
jgi:hypothetical protein